MDTDRTWGIFLKGHQFDLADWLEMLKPPFEPWVERDGNDYVLFSREFAELTEPEEVRDRAISLIERLNGSLRAVRDTREVELANVVQFSPDGKRVHHVLVVAAAEARSRVSGVAVTIAKADGTEVPPPAPKASIVQDWITAAQQYDELSDALVYFARGEWFDIYKALECLEMRSGGESYFIALDWAPQDEIKRLKRTANWIARHAKRKFDRPPKPMELHEARQLLATLLKRAFEEASSMKSCC